MKKITILLLLIVPVYSWSQSNWLTIDSIESEIVVIDTVQKGNMEYVDSAKGLKVIYPMRLGQVNGMVEGYFLEGDRLAFRGKAIKNLKEEDWEYFQYDSIGNPWTYQSFSYNKDSLSGPFFRKLDSLWIRGNYKNDSLDGFMRRDLISLSDSGDTIITPIDSGLYSRGKRYGEWTFYKDGKLDKIGYYENGLMHRNWKIYDTYDDDTTIVMREIQYFEGRKTGNEKKYFHYEFMPCTKDGDSSCFDTIKVNEFEQIPWQDGKLAGTYYKTDASGNTLEKGTYSDDQRTGEWVFTDPLEKSEETKNFLNDELNGPYVFKENEKTLITGTYAKGKKHKIWVYRDETGHKLREENYNMGVREGDWLYYHARGNLGLKKVFEKDIMVELTEYDKAEVETMIFEFEYEDDKPVTIKFEQLSKDSLEFIDLLYSPEDGKINDETFMELFKEKGKDTTLFKRNGGYEVKKNGKVWVQGAYVMNIKNGNWDLYYNPSIIWRETYDMGFKKFDMFLFSTTKEPMDKGDYVLWYGPERPKVEFKIKDGLRNGKSVYYDVNGEEIKEEKYKDGVLQ